MSEADWAPKNIDVETASAARLYDFFLGGSYNFEVDRELGRQVAAVAPAAFDLARLNRAFLRRAVRYLVEQGIDQFLDIGSGIPTAGNVHEIAQRANPDARVVYVDNEPVAVAHSELLLEGNPNAGVIEADLRDPDSILRHEKTRRLLDFRRPIGLLTVAVYHFIPDADDPRTLAATYRDALPSGSYLALSHGTEDSMGETIRQIMALYKNSQNPITTRTRSEMTALFEGFDLVEPGVVFAPQWRPDSPEDVGERPEESSVYAAVGRKP
ncbi:SAM-dependent methyltransferase [Kutzneria sp. NPDC052558]|uniref:SAM-dependent methyltransferase n=1 Tax=Kutzneria sp. NPDC052558 TaxID=3364121 RepID=UPI0037C502CE